MMNATVHNGGRGFVPSQNRICVSREVSHLPTGYYPPKVQRAISALTPGMYRAAHECHAIHGAGYGATLANILGKVSFAVAGNFRIRDRNGHSMPLGLHILFAGARLSGKSKAHDRFNAPVEEAMKGWRKRWLFDNVTLPALLRKIRGGSIWSMLSMPEGRGYLGSQLGRSFHDLSDLYDSNIPSFDRADDGDDIAEHVPDSTIFVTCINVQDDAHRAWLDKHAQDAIASGYLFRLLMMETDELSHEGAGATQSESALLDYDQRIVELITGASIKLNTMSVSQLPLIEVSSEAEQILRRAQEHFQYMASAALDERDEIVFAVRLATNARRIAGCMHVFERYEGTVSFDTMDRAVTIAEFFGAQWLTAVFPPKPIPEVAQRAQRLLDYLYDRQYRWREVSWRKSDIEELAPNFGWNRAEMKEAITSICGEGLAHVIPRTENGRRVVKLELDSYPFAPRSACRGKLSHIG
ncbi:DUF3987 domain-containing protein [Paraburkholderia sp. B3]|uniref:DUF3987 domain-containing protein n=1 Tax=Paraburkholderia sp. B3 TaxID=3134791 RepID=UPI003981DF65